MIISSNRAKLLLFVFAIFVPDMAHAHMYSDGTGGFFSGFEHPFTGLDHFLAMFAVGLWGAQMGGRSVWILPITFPLVMVIGGILGIFGIDMVGVEIGIALSVVILGLAIVFRFRPSQWVVLALVCVFAIYHGYAHGTELPKAVNPADFAVGFVVATGLIHIIGIGVGLISERFFSGKLTRILGGFVIAGGVYFLSQAL